MSTRLHTFVCLCVFMLSECARISQMKPTQAEFLVHRYSCLFYHCAQTHGSLPRKQSPAHSVAFCSISELGETKAACWLHSKPTGTGCFPPEEDGVHIFQPRSRGSHPRPPPRTPRGEAPTQAGSIQASQDEVVLSSKASPVLSGTLEALEKEHGLQIIDKA